jgi:hypothetical protein
MNALSNLSVQPVEASQLKEGSVISCSNSDGRIVISNGRPVCSCGEPVIKLKSDTDPAPTICCQSIERAYHLPEVERRAMPRFKKSKIERSALMKHWPTLHLEPEKWIKIDEWEGGVPVFSNRVKLVFEGHCVFFRYGINPSTDYIVWDIYNDELCRINSLLGGGVESNPFPIGVRDIHSTIYLGLDIVDKLELGNLEVNLHIYIRGKIKLGVKYLPYVEVD